jgi:hypothetical protein
MTEILQERNLPGSIGTLGIGSEGKSRGGFGSMSDSPDMLA